VITSLYRPARAVYWHVDSAKAFGEGGLGECLHSDHQFLDLSEPFVSEALDKSIQRTAAKATSGDPGLWNCHAAQTRCLLNTLRRR
jgi:hypothetical protein